MWAPLGVKRRTSLAILTSDESKKWRYEIYCCLKNFKVIWRRKQLKVSVIIFSITFSVTLHNCFSVWKFDKPKILFSLWVFFFSYLLSSFLKLKLWKICLDSASEALDNAIISICYVHFFFSYSFFNVPCPKGYTHLTGLCALWISSFEYPLTLLIISLNTIDLTKI